MALGHVLLAPIIANAEVQLRPEHAANRLEGIQVIRLVDGVLTLKAERPTTGLVVIFSNQPLVLDSQSNVEAKLRPGWDGTLGYSLYGLELTVPTAGEVRVGVRSIPPPKAAVPTTESETVVFSHEFQQRPSRFPNDPEAFRRWQESYRVKLAAWLMGGGMPSRVPLDARVIETQDFPHFSLRRVAYRSQRDRTTTLLISLPKGVAQTPLMLALHGHENAWGEAAAAAYRSGQADDFLRRFYGTRLGGTSAGHHEARSRP